MARPISVLSCLGAGLILAACGAAGPAGPGSTSGPAHPAATTAPATSAPGASGASAMWLTYHRDRARTGVAAQQPALGPLTRSWRSVLDGQVYAEPLVDGRQVIAATEANTVYSLDAQSGAVVWSTNLGAPEPGRALPCGNVSPSGITGTPVIDLADNLVWVVAFVKPGDHQLVSLSLDDGKVRSRQRIELANVSDLAEQQRGALTIAAGQVLVPFGGLYGDCGNYRGFLVSFPTTGSGQSTFVDPTAREGGIWAPPGAVVDAKGGLWVAVGNSSSSSSFDEGNTVLKLSGGLQVEDSFTPSNWVQLNRQDLDLGSVSPTLVGSRYVFQIGKEGVGYLLDQNKLGGIGGEVSSKPVCHGGAFGATAVDGSVVFVPCRDGLYALRVGQSGSLSTLWRAPSITPGPPVVAAGKVWDVTLDGQLVALDEGTGKVVRTEPVGKGASSFPSLAVAGGRIFAQGGKGIVAIAGI